LRSNFADFFLLVFVGAIFPLQIAIAETIMGWLGVREVDERPGQIEVEDVPHGSWKQLLLLRGKRARSLPKGGSDGSRRGGASSNSITPPTVAVPGVVPPVVLPPAPGQPVTDRVRRRTNDPFAVSVNDDVSAER